VIRVKCGNQCRASDSKRNVANGPFPTVTVPVPRTRTARPGSPPVTDDTVTRCTCSDRDAVMALPGTASESPRAALPPSGPRQAAPGPPGPPKQPELPTGKAPPPCTSTQTRDSDSGRAVTVTRVQPGPHCDGDVARLGLAVTSGHGGHCAGCLPH
jgi:hypothetical protein